MQQVPLAAAPTDAVLPMLGAEGQAELDEALRRLARQVDGRRLWHVNSTAQGGGVAELLSTLLPYALGAGLPVSWQVVELEDCFFEVSKRLHNWLHGDGEADEARDDEELGEEERSVYEAALRGEAEALAALVSPGDLAVLHDPQTAGLIPSLRARGARVVWRCHIGADRTTDRVRAAQGFLLPYVQQADVVVFSRSAHRWEGLGGHPTAIVPPCIDIASPKNQPLDDELLDAGLRATGLLGGCGAAMMTQEEPIDPDARLVVQVSRWDRLKDPLGVIEAFVDHGPADPSVHLCLAGPQTSGVADDPEAAEVLAVARERWAELPPADRRRVHLAELSMDDLAANALMVNALQRRADVIVQKSLAEGFGLAVAESMWKSRPVVATRVGGIQDQIEHEVSGLLIDDPTDLAACGAAMQRVLDEPGLAQALGRHGRQRVCERYLPAHHIRAEADALGLARGIA